MKIARKDAVQLRMISLLLAPRPDGYPGGAAPKDVAEVVTWLGAMQAQDAASAAWSFGVRLPGLTTESLRAACEAGQAIRTWPMRGTVHYVPPRDAHWMLDLMGARALAGAARRRAYLGLSDAVAERAVEVLARVLAGGRRLTRAQCLDALRDDGLEVGGQLGYHLLWYASQRGVTCFAPAADGQADGDADPGGGRAVSRRVDAFMLLDEFVPDPHRPEPDEALATIALRYFRGHGPTTAADFAGWTGLPVTQCRRGIAAAGDALAHVSVDGVPTVADRALIESYTAPKKRTSALTLPGFDEYLLGYKDRSMMLDDEHRQAIIPGGNGVFMPTVVLDGRVAGTWRRATHKRRVDVTVTEFRTLAAKSRQAVEAAFGRYGDFLGLPCNVTWA